MIGHVKWFSNEKGFGFLTDGKKDFFVHYRSIKGDGFKSLDEGQKVEFDIAESPKGQSAINVVVVD